MVTMFAFYREKWGMLPHTYIPLHPSISQQATPMTYSRKISYN